jgi:hypothetical protein
MSGLMVVVFLLLVAVVFMAVSFGLRILEASGANKWPVFWRQLEGPL